MYQVSIITVSDSVFAGRGTDESGPQLKNLMESHGFQVAEMVVVPDQWEKIEKAIGHASDTLKVALVLTTGGTGFSKRDITPEVTKHLIEKEVPGIAEEMRRISREITSRAILSRGVSGIRGDSLIVNLPGSPRAAVENITAVLSMLPHGLDILQDKRKNCASGTVLSIHTSGEKGVKKNPVTHAQFVADYGIQGDAHAGCPIRQVSLLAVEDTEEMRKFLPHLEAGAMAENVLTQGFDFSLLEIGSQIQIGKALCVVSQIGKDCHNAGCAIKQSVGVCAMPQKGIFVKVIQGGKVGAGDPIFLV